VATAALVGLAAVWRCGLTAAGVVGVALRQGCGRRRSSLVVALPGEVVSGRRVDDACLPALLRSRGAGDGDGDG
jgi:hypothetical protein